MAHSFAMGLGLALIVLAALPFTRCATFGTVTEEELRDLGTEAEELARFEREVNASNATSTEPTTQTPVTTPTATITDPEPTEEETGVCESGTTTDPTTVDEDSFIDGLDLVIVQEQVKYTVSVHVDTDVPPVMFPGSTNGSEVQFCGVVCDYRNSETYLVMTCKGTKATGDIKSIDYKINSGRRITVMMAEFNIEHKDLRKGLNKIYLKIKVCCKGKEVTIQFNTIAIKS